MAVEASERKKSHKYVAEVDLRVEMDWRQRSRHLWLVAGDANKKFFRQAANGWRRSKPLVDSNWAILLSPAKTQSSKH